MLARPRARPRVLCISYHTAYDNRQDGLFLCLWPETLHKCRRECLIKILRECSVLLLAATNIRTQLQMSVIKADMLLVKH